MTLWHCPECGIVYSSATDRCTQHSETWPDGTFERSVEVKPLPETSNAKFGAEPGAPEATKEAAKISDILDQEFFDKRS